MCVEIGGNATRRTATSFVPVGSSFASPVRRQGRKRWSSIVRFQSSATPSRPSPGPAPQSRSRARQEVAPVVRRRAVEDEIRLLRQEVRAGHLGGIVRLLHAAGPAGNVAEICSLDQGCASGRLRGGCPLRSSPCRPTRSPRMRGRQPRRQLLRRTAESTSTSPACRTFPFAGTVAQPTRCSSASATESLTADQLPPAASHASWARALRPHARALVGRKIAVAEPEPVDHDPPPVGLRVDVDAGRAVR